MIVYSWILEHINILGFIVDVLSLVITTILTVVIYRLERSHEKERERLEGNAKELVVKEAAKNFLIDNEEEIEYLPLCIVASKLKLKRKHCRNIITKFLRCEETVQKEILIQANVKDNNISLESVNYAVDCIRNEFDNAKFGRDILYEGAKYLHRAFERYYDKSIDNVNPYIFEPAIPVPQTLKALRIDYKWNLYSFMYEYIKRETHIEMQPPVDMVFEECDLGCCPEDEMTFWTMRIIIDGCRVLRDVNYIDEAIIQTQEDMYYYTLLMLYEAYCKEEAGDGNE